MNAILKRSLQIIAIIIFLTTGVGAQISQIQIPSPSGFVNDFAGKLSPETKQGLENLLTNFKSRSNGIEVTVVTIPSEQMNDYSIEEYTLELGRRWGVGGRSNEPSLVLLVAIKPQLADGKYSGSTRLEISRHLEGDIPDGLAGELIRRMRVDFQNGNFDQALTTGVQTILATIAEKRGFSMEGVDSRSAYRPPQRRSSPSRGISSGTIFLILIIVFVLFNLFRSRGGGGGGGGYRRRGSDWWIAPVIWGGGGSGWGGGNSGGSSGDGGGFGGFGGGGDFGGGGASDNW